MAVSTALVAAGPALVASLNKALDIPGDHYRTKRHAKEVDAYRDVAVAGVAVGGGLAALLIAADAHRQHKREDHWSQMLAAATASGDEAGAQEAREELQRLTRRKTLIRKVLSTYGQPGIQQAAELEH